jgi:dihydroneopterin aldolase
MGLIEIEGMQFYAYHGHFEAERIVGNNFELSVKIETNCTAAAISDNLTDALNYQEVYLLIKSEMEKTSHLLENVAQRILDSLFSKFNEIQKASIKVSKLNPPMGGEIGKVSVTLSKTKD